MHSHIRCLPPSLSCLCVRWAVDKPLPAAAPEGPGLSHCSPGVLQTRSSSRPAGGTAGARAARARERGGVGATGRVCGAGETRVRRGTSEHCGPVSSRRWPLRPSGHGRSDPHCSSYTAGSRMAEGGHAPSGGNENCGCDATKKEGNLFIFYLLESDLQKYF